MELRISLRNQIAGSWELIRQPELLEMYYQFSFVPHVQTRAVFDSSTQYETFDIHFGLSFLSELGIDYRLLDRFVQKILKERPTDLTPKPRRCPTA